MQNEAFGVTPLPHSLGVRAHSSTPGARAPSRDLGCEHHIFTYIYFYLFHPD